MIAWHASMKTPEYPQGRELVIIANDVTFQSGSFGVKEDDFFRVHLFIGMHACMRPPFVCFGCVVFIYVCVWVCMLVTDDFFRVCTHFCFVVIVGEGITIVFQFLVCVPDAASPHPPSHQPPTSNPQPPISNSLFIPPPLIFNNPQTPQPQHSGRLGVRAPARAAPHLPLE